MSKLEPEAQFFHHIAPAVIELVNNHANHQVVATDKGRPGDYATQVDVDVENLVVAEIQQRFAGDQILAEEGHADTVIPKGRIWIIDPICGTNNLGKGINNFCTNIALADGGQLVAACVVDHSQGEYFWSIGDQLVYVGNKLSQPPPAMLGQKIDVDLGSVRNADGDRQQQYHTLLGKLIDETSFDLISMNTSLGFVYAAIGKTDGFINLFCHPWDICAASFLIQQAGGTITALDGSPWSVTTAGAIAGRTPEIHQQLLELYSSS